MPVGRMEALTDGVLAIVMTLLILLIEPPAAGLSDERLHQVLLEDWHMFISYLISFVLLCLYWWRHHILFHYLNRSDGVLTVLNLLFLFCTALIPFPTALLVEYFGTPDAEIAVLIFGGVNLVCVGVLASMWLYATRRQRLVKDTLGAVATRRLLESTIASLVVYVVAIITSFFSPTTALFLFFLVPLLHILPRYLVTHEVVLGE